MTVALLTWYLLYVVLSAFARGFMSTTLFGNINVALVFGLLQFVTTFGIAVLYSRYADRRLTWSDCLYCDSVAEVVFDGARFALQDPFSGAKRD